MTDKEFNDFKTGAREVTTRPTTHFAKKVSSIKDVTKGRVSYHYERVHQVTFTDGTAIVVSNDYVEGHTKMKAGGYVIAVGPGMIWSFCTEEQLEKSYR